jgi:hypothetical protein
MAVPARVNVVTLGALDLPRLRGFYKDALGWRTLTEAADEFALLDTGGAKLALYPFKSLAEDARSQAVPRAGFPGFALAINVGAREDVDAVIDQLRAAGAIVLKEAVDEDWGGRSAYFADPEGNPWEVAWVPGSTFDEHGALVWPK